MINYYGRFIQNLNSILFPLNKLLRKNTPFIWSKECEAAFHSAKKAFTSNQVLIHFNPRLPLVLATDVSSYGIGAVLSHSYPNGIERVIQFASQTFTETQRKYSQIDKKAYAIIFGIKKFFQYLYGQKFTLITDHRPLVQIFSPTAIYIHGDAHATLRDILTRIQSYKDSIYEIQYRKSEKHANADCLSRLPVPNHEATIDVVDAFQVETINTLPITAIQIAKETIKDTELKDLLRALQTGTQIHKSKRFNIEQIEYSLQNGVIIRGHKVVVPKVLRTQILKELHSSHFGVVKIKSLARRNCWWQGIDKDIEALKTVQIAMHIKTIHST